MKEKGKEMEINLKALANRRRLAIVGFIKSKRELTVGEIAEEIKLSFRSTSKHLGVLSSAGILEKEQKSAQVYYFLSDSLKEPARRIVALL